jgi:hypothetical protein
MKETAKERKIREVKETFDRKWNEEFEKAHGYTWEESVQERWGEIQKSQDAREKRIKRWEWLTDNILPYGILIIDIVFRIIYK